MSGKKPKLWFSWPITQTAGTLTIATLYNNVLRAMVSVPGALPSAHVLDSQSVCESLKEKPNKINQNKTDKPKQRSGLFYTWLEG